MADETDKTNSGPSLSADPKELSPDGVDITAEQDGGLYKTIKTPGTGDSGPQAGDKVFVHYVGTLANGEKFDSSRDRGQKFDFTLGQGSVIKGWDVGVATMKKGEVAVLTCRQDYAYGSRGSPPKIPPNATLLFEVELFEWKGEDISPESDESIVRSKIKTGKQGSMPVDGAKVKVHIVGKHKDTTFEDREVEFELGDGAAHGIIPGIEHALTRFHQQECSNLIMKSKHAYGTTGCPEKNIPPNADLEYQVTLIEFEKMKDSWEMEADEKIEQSEIAKGKGNGYFKSGNYKRAVQFYQRIVNYLDSESSLEGDAALKRNDLLLAAYLNHAQCALKLNDLNDVYECCNKALEIKPDSEKAYFRKGQAKLSAGEHEEAIKDFQKVLEIDSENKAAKNQIIIAQHHIKQEKARSKKLYGGMFDKFAAIDAKLEPDYSQVLYNVGAWDNDMAKHMMPLDQEMAAFGEEMPKPQYTAADVAKCKADGSEKSSKDNDAKVNNTDGAVKKRGKNVKL